MIHDAVNIKSGNIHTRNIARNKNSPDGASLLPQNPRSYLALFSKKYFFYDP